LTIITEWHNGFLFPPRIFVVPENKWVTITTTTTEQNVLASTGKSKKTRELTPTEFDHFIRNNRVFGFYGVDDDIVMDPTNMNCIDDRKFLIRDVRNFDLFDPAKIVDKRKTPSGCSCSFLEVHFIMYILLRYLYHFQKQISPETVFKRIDDLIRSSGRKNNVTTPALLHEQVWYQKLLAIFQEDTTFVYDAVVMDPLVMRLQLLRKKEEFCPLMRSLFISAGFLLS
jgi:hypothetical protein